MITRRHSKPWAVVFVVCLLYMVTVSVLHADDAITFNQNVRPILADKCFHCHGPDSATRQADLRLDEEESTKRDRDGTVVVKPGNPSNSELLTRIMSTDPDLMMPPPDSGRSLNTAEKQILQSWIADGASWEGHWAFIVPTRPSVPDVSIAGWPRNAIDHFVLAKLEAAGLQPAPEAEQTTWIRRVTLDLTGLPPTPAEVDAFLADHSATAHESVVDRLLASPRYGEHMAVSWLDAARYADTDGYQNDGPRTMFRYRDWVIDAFNSNMPFDQFTIEQLAGDLLPNASLSQRIATGFNRNHRYNSEAGLVLEEFLLENAVDRVDTTSTVWMGLTIGCARCHDHKYDPISQREYYQLISFFDNITESGRAIKFGNSEPWVISPTNKQQAQLTKLDTQLQAAEQKRQAAVQHLEHADDEFFFSNTIDGESAEAAIVSEGLSHYFRFEDMAAEGITVESGQPVLRDGFERRSATVGGSEVFALGNVGDIACQTRSSISFWLKPERLESGVVLSRQSPGTTRPGFTVELRDGHLQFFIITRWVAGVSAVETQTPLRANEWVHVTLTNDGSQRAAGMHIWLNGEPAATNVLYNTNSNTGGTAKTAVLRIGGGVVGDRFKGQVDELRFYNRSLFPDEISILAEPQTVAEILNIAETDRTPRMNAKRLAWLLAASGDSENPDVQKAAAAAKEHFQLRLQRVRLRDSFPTTMVMQERSTPVQTHVRVRGIYNSYGDVVPSDVPAVFPPMPSKAHNNRHDFAKWLVSGQHPLTARVIVNRYWQHYFGTGIVKTSEDFGLQGELPSHPELLDWLAVEFVKSGWNVKTLQKQIVLSSTYRQSSHHVPRRSKADSGAVTASTIDPENRLLWRGPRLRLTARQLRDQALFVSGLMTPEIGGPSVSPYQPAKLWDEMSNMKYQQSKGKDLYRRGLYTIWKRTVAPPSLAILDAADRESCIVRPRQTNTPLQALTLLNETTFVEAARHLAVRMQQDGGDDPIGFAFRTLTSRHLSEQQRLVLTDARAQYVAQFSADPDKAAKLLSVGESMPPSNGNAVALAADTMVCNVLLNLDEVVTKE
ncbi:MAG: DUF1553 domain-containing protein [Planctomycetaceae bacterium]